jgi:hypothetical protein
MKNKMGQYQVRCFAADLERGIPATWGERKANEEKRIWTEKGGSKGRYVDTPRELLISGEFTISSGVDLDKSSADMFAMVYFNNLPVVYEPKFSLFERMLNSIKSFFARFEFCW